MGGQDWQALADAVRRRRLYLNLAQDELSRRAGPSHQTIRNIEQVARSAYSPILDDLNEGRMSVERGAELIARIEDQAARLKAAAGGPDEMQGRPQP